MLTWNFLPWECHSSMQTYSCLLWVKHTVSHETHHSSLSGLDGLISYLKTKEWQFLRRKLKASFLRPGSPGLSGTMAINRKCSGQSRCGSAIHLFTHVHLYMHTHMRVRTAPVPTHWNGKMKIIWTCISICSQLYSGIFTHVEKTNLPKLLRSSAQLWNLPER